MGHSDGAAVLHALSHGVRGCRGPGVGDSCFVVIPTVDKAKVATHSGTAFKSAWSVSDQGTLNPHA